MHRMAHQQPLRSTHKVDVAWGHLVPEVHQQESMIFKSSARAIINAYFRWDPDPVINGIISPIKWPYTWGLPGVIS